PSSRGTSHRGWLVRFYLKSALRYRLLASFESVSISSMDGECQRRIVPSCAAPASHWPSGEKATEFTLARVWSAATSCQLTVSQSRTMPSSPEVARRRPSGEKHRP